VGIGLLLLASNGRVRMSLKFSALAATVEKEWFGPQRNAKMTRGTLSGVIQVGFVATLLGSPADLGKET